MRQTVCGCGCGFEIAPGMTVRLIAGVPYAQGCVSPPVEVTATGYATAHALATAGRY